MPRYIDAEELEKEIKSLQITLCIARQSGKDLLGTFATEYKKSILKIIDEQPTAEVAPKIEGEWVFKEGKDGGFCSVCDSEALLYPDFIGFHCGIEILSNFCPKCGAHMKGGADDGKNT